MSAVTILIPTYGRITSLAVTLTSLCSQTYRNFDVIISDQNDDKNVIDNQSIQAVMRLLHNHGQHVTVYKHFPRLGVAEQRQFLLDKSETKYSLFLDDDLILEPYVIEGMVRVIEEERCGFVGRAVVGLSYEKDFRPEEQQIELWHGRVQPEIVKPRTKKWERHLLHNAANLLHVEQDLHISAEQPVKYKIAWIGGCVLYDTNKLRQVGGFTFWTHLPREHCGEDVLAQIHLMSKFGGCGLLPSGVYHQELPTTVPNRTINAPEYLGG